MNHSRALITKHVWVGPVLVVIAYAALRTAIVPNNGDAINGVSHDGAYMWLVANNLLDSRGFVNDAHWLVFLNPDSLPVPYHNANPLHPVATAAFSAFTGRDLTYSGFLLSALSSPLLMSAIMFLVQPFVKNWWRSLVLAICATLFPAVFRLSLMYGNDALCLALFIACLAALIRGDSSAAVAVAGAVFGLAWLTRSISVVLLPAVAYYCVCRWGLRGGSTRLVAFCLIALLTVSPWLIHNWKVWGNPIRSDSMYYLLQDIGAERFGGSVERYWHSTEPPPGLLNLALNEPGRLIASTLRGLPLVIYGVLAEWSMRNVASGLLIGIAVIVFVLREWQRLFPELLSLALFGTILFLLLALRGSSFEARYVVPLTVFFVIFAAAGTYQSWIAVENLRGCRLARVTILLVATLLWFLLVPVRVLEVYRWATASDVKLHEYRRVAVQVNSAYAHGSPVVVGTKPYFYTQATLAPSLSIPESDDEYLLRYMERYGARFVLLTPKELRFWRPKWISSGKARGLELRARIAGAYLFERKSDR